MEGVGLYEPTDFNQSPGHLNLNLTNHRLHKVGLSSMYAKLYMLTSRKMTTKSKVIFC